jgi:uncharacterized protein YaiI (UPF0178 family)
MPDATAPIQIYIDADACPVKDEIYKVAQRYGLKNYVVSNAFMMIPRSDMIERVVVDAGPDVADDRIAEHVAPGDVAVTNDIPLAERVLKAGGHALAPNGKPFTENSIGAAIAQRSLMEQLRSTGDILGGPKPFDRNDRSRFLQVLDEIIQKERRRRG